MAKRMKKLNIVNITISDSRTIKTDKSGIKLTSLIKKAGHNVKKKIIVPDDIYEIRAAASNFILDNKQ